METMIIESETVSRGMKPEGLRPLGGAAETPVGNGKDETEAVDGTTVFIGRASFRMTPISTDQNFGRGFDYAPSSDDAAEVVAPPAATEWFVRTEDAVVLMPPESVASVEAVDIGTGLETMRLPRSVVQPASAVERPPRRATKMWMVGAALLVGATVTLSAQAVMRRPARSEATATTPRARLSAVTPPSRTPGTPASNAAAASAPEVLPKETEEPAALDVAAAVAPRTTAVVVASTVSLPFARTERLAVARSPRALGRARPPRAGRFPAAGAPAVSSARVTDGVAPVAWVDPFAVQAGGTPVSAKAAAAKSTAAKPVNAKAISTRSATTGGTAWVDPFAD